MDSDLKSTSIAMMKKAPSQELIDALNRLCSDPKNVVFLVSGREKSELAGWFEQCEELGIAAEHGYFIRWNKNSQWESTKLATDSDWKSTARPMMQQYTDATQGSYIEDKKTALVWHYEEADVNFGLSQSTALKDHLQGMLGDYPVYVKSGHKIVEVIPQGMSKGITVQKLIATMTAHGTIPDFILCVGDDRSDEDMFKVITSTRSNSEVPDTAKIFACTIGFKPSSAKYFLESPLDALKMLEHLTILPTSDSVHSQIQGMSCCILVKGMSKGITVQKLIATMTAHGTTPDFILCVGDDRSDEDMFKVITSTRSSSEVPDTAKIFACTIGFKPSSAKYFLESPFDVLKMLERLTTPPTSDPVDLHGQVSKDSQE